MKIRLSILVLTALLLSACGSRNYGTPAPVQATNPTPLAGDGQVVISGFAFTPVVIAIKVGAKVTWTNQDNVAHTVVAKDGSFKSGSLNQGETFSFTFNTPGSYTYFCSIHPNMLGSVIVVP